MHIDDSSWHCQVYRWWYRHKYGGDPAYPHSNLCPYMRAVIFWAPSRILLGTWVKVGSVPLNAVTIPALLLAIPVIVGRFSYGAKIRIWIIYIVSAGVFSFSTMILYIVSLLTENTFIETKKNEIKSWSFWKLLHAYLRSAHDRVCPEVDWTK